MWRRRWAEEARGVGWGEMAESPMGCAESFVLYFAGQQGLNSRGTLLWPPLRYRMASYPKLGYKVEISDLPLLLLLLLPLPLSPPTPRHPPAKRV